MSTGLRVSSASELDRAAWNELVGRSPGASFCHLFDWLTVLRRAYGMTCRYLYASKGDRWLGVLPLVHMKSPFTGNRLVSLPFLDQGGILVHSEEAGTALREAAFGLAAEVGAAGVDFRGKQGLEERESTEPRRFRFVLPLGESEEHLWENIGPKVRNQIRKAEKSGLETHEVKNEDRLQMFYSIFARNMRDLGSPVHSLDFFGEILAVLGRAASVYIVSRDGGAAVAGAISIRFGDCVSVPWASSLRSARPDCPNHALYWRILRDALAGGAREFDFGRSSTGSGTFHFKKQWRARPEALEWQSYSAKGTPEQEPILSPTRHKILVNVWRRLPVSLANRLGPPIRRQLSN